MRRRAARLRLMHIKAPGGPAADNGGAGNCPFLKES
jgi:hypothetical protein